MAAMVAGVSSCSKDDEGGGGGSDPEGTVTVSVRNSSNGSTNVDIGGRGFYIDSGNNFRCGNDTMNFVDVGNVGGLDGVRGIPSSGWAKSVAVQVGHGYVLNWNNYIWQPAPGATSYARLYVVEEIIGTNHGVLGYVVKYQTPFVP